MKTFVSRIATLLCAIALLAACETSEHVAETPLAQKPDVRFRTVSFKTLELTNPATLISLKEFVGTPGKYGHRGANSQNTYLIDSTSVAQISTGDGYQSFTFSVKPEPDDDFIHNIIVSVKPNGETDVMLAEYGLNTTISNVTGRNYKSHIESIQFIPLQAPTLLQAKDEGIDYLDTGFCLKVGYWIKQDKCEGELVTPADRPECFGRDGRRLMIDVFIVLASNCGGGNSLNYVAPVIPPSPGQTGTGWLGVGSTNPPGSVSPGNVSPGNVSPIITTPILIDRLLIHFLNQLPDVIRDWWNLYGDPDAVEDFHDYLAHNGYSPESMELVEDLIQDIIDTPVDPDIDMLVGGISLLQYVDIEDALRCFNRNAPATITIYVDQPVPHSSALHNFTDVGHSFISIEQGGIRRVVGFYPTEATSLNDPVSAGMLVNDGGANYDVSIKKNISPAQLKKILDAIINFSYPYNLYSNNCSDFSIKMAKLAGLPIPSAFTRFDEVGNGGDNPGKLGHLIETMPVPAGAERTVGAGQAPTNAGGC